jgi:hypothetical protein
LKREEASGERPGDEKPEDEPDQVDADLESEEPEQLKTLPKHDLPPTS